MISLAASQSMPEPLQIETINELIHVIRGERVMLDGDLARYYGVETKVLNTRPWVFTEPLPKKPRTPVQYR